MKTYLNKLMIIVLVFLGGLSTHLFACNPWPYYCIGLPGDCVVPGYPEVTDTKSHKILCQQTCQGEWVYLGGFWSYASGCAN